MTPDQPQPAAGGGEGQQDALAIQRRVVPTLMSTQVLGGVGMSSAIAVSALVAAEVSGSDSLAGLATTTQVLGAALITIPVAALMARHGRRVGLVAAYLIALVGATLVVTATAIATFPLLLLGTALIGAATTAANQSRYAGVDLAPDHRRGLHLSLVVWASTVGAVAGPNLVGPGASVARSLGLPELTGSFLFAGVGFILAILVLTIFLRPDPLLTARRLEAGSRDPAGGQASAQAPVLRGSIRRGFAVLRAHPVAAFGTVVLATGHAVMVAVMVMTPVHMTHGHAEVEVVGFVISVHILGMYGLSPVFGGLVDRWGAVNVAILGASLLAVASLLSALSPQGWSPLLLIGLLLLGLGWSATMVSGSGLVAGAVPGADRPAAQGAADLAMGLLGAAAGALGGLIVGVLGYAWLCAGAALIALALGASAVRSRRVVSLGG